MVSLQDLDYLLALLGASTTAEGVGHLVVQFWDFISYSLKSYRQGAAKEAKLFKGLQRLIEVNDFVQDFSAPDPIGKVPVLSGNVHGHWEMEFSSA